MKVRLATKKTLYITSAENPVLAGRLLPLRYSGRGCLVLLVCVCYCLSNGRLESFGVRGYVLNV